MILEVHYNEDSRTFRINVPGGVQIPAINEWPGWRRHPTGTYMAPAWPSSILAVGKLTAHDLRWDAAATQKRDALLTDLTRLRESLTRDPWAPGPLPTERRPEAHQRQAVGALRWAHWRALLADDMGLGKTSSALWAAYDAGVVRILVICPVSVKFNWQREIEQTLGSRWDVTVIDGTAKQRAQQLAESVALMASRAIVINYDLLRHLSEQQLEDLKVFATNGMLLLDESHYLKSRDTDRTKLVAKIASSATYVIALTGTPIRNLADDLYSQVEIVRPGTWTSYRDFAKRHLVIQAVKLGKREIHKVVGVRNLDALNAVMNTLQIKRAKSEVLGLPPKIYTYPELQLEGELLRVYKAMKEFARIELSKLVQPTRKPSDAMHELGMDFVQHGSQRITGQHVDAAMGAQPVLTVFDPRARSAIEQAMRCEQIANGFIGGIPAPVMEKIGPDLLKIAEKIDGRPNELMFPTHPKVVWLLETIESVLKQGGAPIVYSRFNAPLFWIAAKLSSMGIKSVVLHGGLSATGKADVVGAFQDKQTDVLLAQVKIAEGWNATRCQDVIFWNRDWSPAINVQAEDRAHRMGQKGTVNVQIPIMRNSIELLIHKRLTQKGADAAQALRNVTIEELMEAL